MSVWLLLHVYILVDVLDFVIVLFQSGVFDYILVYSVWGGAYVDICKTYLCTPRKLLRGAKNGVARDVWEFQRYPSQILSSMVKCVFIPKYEHAITTLDNYGLQLSIYTIYTVYISTCWWWHKGKAMWSVSPPFWPNSTTNKGSLCIMYDHTYQVSGIRCGRAVARPGGHRHRRFDPTPPQTTQPSHLVLKYHTYILVVVQARRAGGPVSRAFGIIRVPYTVRTLQGGLPKS